MTQAAVKTQEVKQSNEVFIDVFPLLLMSYAII